MNANALCFGDNFPASGAPCVVQVSEQGLSVIFGVGSSESRSETVSFSRLSVSAGGLDLDQLVLKWDGQSGERTLYFKSPDLIREFRQAAPAHLDRPFEQAAERVRHMRHRRRLVWSVVGGTLLALIVGLWFGSDLLVRLAVERIPVEWEEKLGEAAYRDFLGHQDVMKEGPAVAAVQEITQRLTQQIPDNPYKFEVTVVKSDVVNAFALPGGHVVVFTGLIKKAESGEEVAGVLGHELNHVLQRHGLERIVKNVGVMTGVAIVIGDQRGLVGLMRQVGVELLTLKFGRAQETEADLTGLQLLYQARIDPTGMITFFQRLAEHDEGRVELLSTHPMSAGRAERLRAEVAKLQQRTAEPFTFDWGAIRASLGVHRDGAP
jgi:Zn-dependent protease with chaperone function